MELRPQPLPAPADWQAAASRAESLFGVHVNPYLTAAGVAELATQIHEHAGAIADAAESLVPRIELAYRHLGLPQDEFRGRLATARAGAELVQALRRPGSRVQLVETLARTTLPATETAVAHSLSQAGIVARALAAFRWERLAPLREAEHSADERGRSAAATMRALRDALAADEFTTRLAPALSATDDAIFDWLTIGQPAPQPMTLTSGREAVPPAKPSGGGHGTRARGASDDAVLGPLTKFLEAHRDEQVVVEWRVQE